MGRIASIRKRAGSLDTFLSLADRVGILGMARYAFQLLASIGFILVMWLWANLPWWAIVMLALAFFALLSFATERALGALAHAKVLAAPLEIDRKALANEALLLSKKVMELYAAYHVEIEAAAAADIKAFFAGEGKGIEARRAATAKLSERFADKYAADVYRVLELAGRALGEKDLAWAYLHGIHADHDMSRLANDLIRVAGDLTYGIQTHA